VINNRPTCLPLLQTMASQNKALLAKLGWKILSQDNLLWALVNAFKAN